MKRFVLLVLFVLLTFSAVSAQDEPTVIRIGHQRGDLFSLAIANGWVEEAFPPDEFTVEFSLFPSGPPLLEALNAGAIDFGGTGDAPPVFAQAAGVPLRYVATQVAYGNEAVIVPADSPIDSLDDLAGKNIAYVRGSSANYLLVLALQAGGVEFTDVESVLLPPADANAAFQSGAVDAWVIWDPFLTVAVTQSQARVLTYASDLHQKRVYFEASEAFVEAHPELLPQLVALLQRGVDWISENPADYSTYLAAETGIEAAVWDAAYSELGAPADITYLDTAIVAGQQQVADTFFALELIPQAIVVEDAVWHPDGVIPDPTPEPTAEATPGS